MLIIIFLDQSSIIIIMPEGSRYIKTIKCKSKEHCT